MRAQLRHRAQIEAISGWLVKALDELVSAINTQPQFVGDVSITSGEGTPEGKTLGSPGDLYLRTDGSTSTTLYVKTAGLRTKTGWTAK